MLNPDYMRVQKMYEGTKEWEEQTANYSMRVQKDWAGTKAVWGYKRRKRVQNVNEGTKDLENFQKTQKLHSNPDFLRLERSKLKGKRKCRPCSLLQLYWFFDEWLQLAIGHLCLSPTNKLDPRKYFRIAEYPKHSQFILTFVTNSIFQLLNYIK